VTAKPISIKQAGGKSGGCALKAAELSWGDLRHVTKRNRGKRLILTCRRRQQRGVILQNSGEARTVPRKGNKERQAERYLRDDRRQKANIVWPSGGKEG